MSSATAVASNNVLKCSEPGCDCCQGPFAIYRTDEAGGKVFTGLVTGPTQSFEDTVRLNDWDGPLDGPGHTVQPAEFMAHMCYYSDSQLPFKPVPLTPWLLSAPVARQHYQGPMKEFWAADHLQVRSNDRVQVVMQAPLPTTGQLARERFWIDVHAVIPHTAAIVGTLVEKLNWLPAPGQSEPLDDNVLVEVSMLRVLAIDKGENW